MSSYAPASPDLSSFYSGSATTKSTSTTATTHIGDTTPLANPGRPLPLTPSACTDFSLPVSPAPTTHQPLFRPQHPHTTHYSQHQHYHPDTGVNFSPHNTQSHLDTPHQPAYSPKSPISPQSGPALPHSHAPHHQQQFQQQAQYSHHTPQSPQRPHAPLQATPLNYNPAHVASPVQAQVYQPYVGQHHQHQQYQLESPQAQSSSFTAPLQNFPQPSIAPTAAPHYLQRPRAQAEYYSPPEHKDEIPMPPRRSAAVAVQPPPIEPSPVRTRFPTARIKRIMQADEEVGKVAQQTPIAVGKALELFMVALVSKSHDVAKDKGAKRVTAQHLKQVVESDDQWDFLREIVGRVSETEDKAKAGGRAKADSSSDEEPTEVKKKGRGGRKKKAT